MELGFPDLVMPQWYALLAPAGLPPDVRKTFEAQVLSVLRSDEVVKQLAASGVADPKGAAELQGDPRRRLQEMAGAAAEARHHRAVGPDLPYGDLTPGRPAQASAN